jgi:CRP/FNR family transcriptional regulator, anaerobic regulatory protein
MNDVALTFACPGGEQRTLSDIAPVRASQNSLKALFADQVAERYTPPRAICWEGEPATHVFHLLEGCVRVCRTMEDGRRAILCFGYAGDLRLRR